MATPTAEQVTAEIDAWFAETIQRPPLSWDVAVYNQALAATAILKERISALLTDAPAPTKPDKIATAPAADAEPKT